MEIDFDDEISKEYEIERFGIGFVPQAEKLSVTLTQAVEYGIYDRAKRADKRKDGKIPFRSQTEGTVLEIAFFNADCVSLKYKVNVMTGAETSPTIAPEKVAMNGITHNNGWRE